MIRDVIFTRKSCHRFQDLCPPAVMARITADKQHINRPVLTSGERCKLRIVGWKEIICATSLLSYCRQDRRKIAHDEIIVGKRYVSERRGMPGDDSFHATGQTPDEVRSPASRVEIVEYIRAMIFDLCLQNTPR